MIIMFIRLAVFAIPAISAMAARLTKLATPAILGILAILVILVVLASDHQGRMAAALEAALGACQAGSGGTHETYACPSLLK